MPADPSLTTETSGEAGEHIAMVTTGGWPRRPGRDAVCDRCDSRAVETCLWPGHAGVLWLCALHAETLSRTGEAVRDPTVAHQSDRVGRMGVAAVSAAPRLS